MATGAGGEYVGAAPQGIAGYLRSHTSTGSRLESWASYALFFLVVACAHATHRPARTTPSTPHLGGRWPPRPARGAARPPAPAPAPAAAALPPRRVAQNCVSV
eukprot:COSAG02_NODE_6515_length_3523_cov_26.200643_3_plen_103_part_00